MSEAERVFVFADLAGYTALTEQHGDDDAATIALRFEEMARSAVHEDLRVVKTIGDAVILVGDDPVAVTRSSLVLLHGAEAEHLFPAVRIGIHQGTSVQRGADCFGSAVNVASRVCGVAGPGQVVCTAAVKDRCAAAPDLAFNALGPRALKNISLPVELFEVAHGSHPLWPVDPICRMRVDTATALSWEQDGRQ